MELNKNSVSKEVLILDGISSQCLPIMRSLSISGYKVTIVTPNRLNSGCLSRFVHRRLIWPMLYKDEDDILNRLLTYLKENRTDLVLGLGDKTAKLLSEYQHDLMQYTNLIVPSFETFSIASDKYKTMQFCMENDIPCPKSIDIEEIDLHSIDTVLQFPVIVKPRIGVGSIGVFKYSEPGNLLNDIAGIKKEYGSLLIQEFIPNDEQYTVEVFCDKQSRVRTCVVIRKSRFFPISGGTSSCSITVSDPDIQRLVKAMMEKLEWIGSANLDVILDKKDHTPKIIEVNPRVGAMVRVVFESGVDIAQLHNQFVFGSRVRDMEEYQTGVVLRNLLLEIPWFILSSFSDIKKSKPRYFTFLGKNVFYQNFRIDDPLISIGYLLGNLRKYFNRKELRKKLVKRAKIS